MAISRLQLIGGIDPWMKGEFEVLKDSASWGTFAGFEDIYKVELGVQRDFG